MGYAWPVDDVMATFSRLHADWHGRDDRIRIVTAPDWTPACSDELYRRARRVADEHDTSMITHVLETRAEMMFNLEHYGKPAVRRLADLGVLRPHDGAGALRLGDRRGARDLRGLGRRRLERSRAPTCACPAASAGCATSWIRAGGSPSVPTASPSPTARTSSRNSAWRATCSGRPTVFERQRLDSEAVLRAAADERRAGARHGRAGSEAWSPGASPTC